MVNLFSCLRQCWESLKPAAIEKWLWNEAQLTAVWLHTVPFSFHSNCTVQKHLGYIKHIFRLYQLHQCYQRMLPNQSSLSCKLLHQLQQLVSYHFQKSCTCIWLHSWHFYHNQSTQELSRGRCVRSQTSSEILIYRLSERRYIRGKLLDYAVQIVCTS